MYTLQIWQRLVSYFSSHPDVEKSGKVRNISKLLNDPITKPWLSFPSNILSIFDKFNILFQTSSTSLIHKIQSETARLLRKVLSFFCFSDVLLNHVEDLASFDYKQALSIPSYMSQFTLEMIPLLYFYNFNINH